jgi:hypothetical protein
LRSSKKTALQFLVMVGPHCVFSSNDNVDPSVELIRLQQELVATATGTSSLHLQGTLQLVEEALNAVEFATPSAATA